MGGCTCAGGGATLATGGLTVCGGTTGAGGRTGGGVTTTSDTGGAAGAASCTGGGCSTGGAGDGMTGVAITGRARGGAGGATAAAAGLATTGGGTGAAGEIGRGGAAAVGRAGASGACTAGRAGAAGCVPRWIAFSTSPGLEMWERSNFGLISSPAGRAERASFAGAASRCALKCCRTFSASSASMELEWVFFSLTPREGRRSRISLLLTSSSLARSLIRTFGCIRPLFLRISVKSSSQPHGISG